MFDQPDFKDADVCPSPNFGERKNDRGIDMIILHYTAMETAQSAQNWLCDERSEVSSHYIIDEAGKITQLVEDKMRAWHAGVGSWKGVSDINSNSIGIEIANLGHDAGLPEFPSVQIESVIKLCQDIVKRHGIAKERVLGHSDITPMRKRDPGEAFPWALLHEKGVGHFVIPAPISGGRFFQKGENGQPIEALQSMLSLYGYATEISGHYCERTEADVMAFQRHFRPEKVDGIADFSTIDTLHRLLSALTK